MQHSKQWTHDLKPCYFLHLHLFMTVIHRYIHLYSTCLLSGHSSLQLHTHKVYSQTAEVVSVQCIFSADRNKYRISTFYMFISCLYTIPYIFIALMVHYTCSILSTKHTGLQQRNVFQYPPLHHVQIDRESCSAWSRDKWTPKIRLVFGTAPHTLQPLSAYIIIYPVEHNLTSQKS